MRSAEEVIKDFMDKLESEFYESRSEEYRRIFAGSEEEPYSLNKEDRDTKAIEEFANSNIFDELIRRL